MEPFNPCEASIACLDMETLGLVIKFADDALCALTMRATCRLMRAMIPAPKRGTPESVWKWAARRGRVTYAWAARDAGARSLMAHCGLELELSLEECAKLWNDAFAVPHALCDIKKWGVKFDVSELSDVLSVIRGDVQVTNKFCKCLPVISDYGAMIMGRHACGEHVLSVGKFVCKYEIDRLDALIYGVARSRRYDICEQLIRLRLKTRIDATHKLSWYLLNAGCWELHRMLYPSRADYRAAMIHEAALSGDRATCEYVRSLDGGLPLYIDQMLNGAAQCRHGIEICKLAREWIIIIESRGECVETLISMPKTVPEFVREGGMCAALNGALDIASGHDNIKVCEYLIAWGADNFQGMLAQACARNAYRAADLACRTMIARKIRILHIHCSRVCRVILDKYSVLRYY